LGQIVTHYQAPDDPTCDFPALLAAVNDVAGVERIRFASPHPRHASARLVEAIRDLPRVCKHMHLPVQSGSTRVLQAMRRRQAEERLAQEAEAKGGASGGVAKGGPALLSVCGCEPLRLPKAGTQVLLFLWEQAEDAPKGALRYRLAHPQCVYELSCAAEVKAELRGGRGRDAERRAYLREWDRVMAERLARRRSDATLRALEAGRPEKGLRLVVRRARPSVLAPNGFNLSVRVENSRDAAQAIYAGPLGGFGVRLRQKDAGPETALVLRLTDPEVTRGVDSQVLALVSSDDFRAVPRNDVLMMDLHVDPKEFPALAGLSGEHLVSAFYTSAQDGKGLEDLPGVPWTGAMASNEVPLTFGPLEARKKQ
jgi:hypothetical protein